MASKVLNTVIDSLYLRVGAVTRPTEWLKATAQEWRQVKSSFNPNSKPHVTVLEGLGKFRLIPKSQKPYEFILANPEIADIRLVSPEKWSQKWAVNTGQIYIAFRSRFMQHEGLPAVFEFLSKLRELLMVPYRVDPFVKVSRLDMAVDIQVSQFFQWNSLNQFVSKSRFREIHAKTIEELDELLSDPSPLSDNKGGAKYIDGQNVVLSRDTWNKIKGGFEVLKAGMGPDASLTQVCHNGDPQTLYFGKKGSPLYARIYDKTAEIKRSGKGYMNDFWKVSGWDGQSKVARVEFSMSGDFLKSAAAFLPGLETEDGEIYPVGDLRDFEFCVAALPSIWQYLTHDWLRHCDRGEDSNRSRWMASELWEAVQRAWPVSNPIIRARPPRSPNLEQIRAQLEGLFLTMCVHAHPKDSKVNTPDMEMARLLEWQFSDEFADRYAERRGLLGRDELSDTWFSENVRRQIMLEGFGS